MQARIAENPPTETTRFTFVAISDLHSRREAPMVALLRSLAPDFALLIGDIVNAPIGGRGLAEYRRDGVHYIINATAGMSGRLPADRRDRGLPNVLPGDVWFSRREGGGLVVRPEGQAPTEVEGSPHFATVITVEGPLVEFRLVNTDGREVDRAILAGPTPSAP